MSDTPEKDALLPVTESDQPTRVEPFHFRRYVGGVERAEGVTIERESTLEAAMRKAAAICPKAPCTVLVLEDLSRPDGDAGRERALEEALERAAGRLVWCATATPGCSHPKGEALALSWAEEARNALATPAGEQQS